MGDGRHGPRRRSDRTRPRPRIGTTWLLVAVWLLAACGEPVVAVRIPARSEGQHVLDLAEILDEAALEARLSALADGGPDIVALTYETAAVSCGEAFRAGGELLAAWSADVAVVAVARPGDFASADDDRARCVGIRPADEFAVPASLREEIVEDALPPIAAGNDWQAVFIETIDRLSAAGS